MEYPNSGTISRTQLPKKHPKSPDFKGSISLTRSVIRQLLDETDGDNIKISMSGWVVQGQNGTFVSLKYNDYKPEVVAAPKSARDLPDDDLPF